VPSWVQMPPSLRWLSLHAPEATDDEVRRTLASCPKELESLGLRGTPVSDEALVELERLSAVNYIDAVDTRMSIAALTRVADGRPGFKCWPRLHVSAPPPTTLVLERRAVNTAKSASCSSE
jgi:hypothetical protein